MSNLDAAIWYSQHGYSVIPVKTDKRPYLKWEPYTKEIADKATIEHWWKQWPDAQVAIVCGEISGITVVDADSQESYDNLTENFIPDSMLIPTVRTPKGYHFYFKYESALHNSTRFFEQCDVKNDRGYVLAPPGRNNNGNYAWADGLKISIVTPPVMPKYLLETIKEYNNNIYNNTSTSIYNNAKTVPVTSGNSLVTNGNNADFLTEGTRDDVLFHLAWHLVKGGMPHANILNYLNFYAEKSNPPFPANEAEAKLKSAIERQNKKSQTSAQDVLEWVLLQDGNFRVTNCYTELQSVTRSEKTKIRVALQRLVEKGVIERVGQNSGEYRKVETDIDEIDWRNADDRTVGVWLPFGLNQLVEMQPGNIVIVGGEPDSGKTAVLLNVIKNNMARHDVVYFSSEMGGAELKKRLRRFEELDERDRVRLNEWKFKSYGYKTDYSDFIEGGEGKLYIIDYMEIYQNFYEVSMMIARIFRKLNGAIAFIALQKNRGSELPLGGYRAMEKCRLGINLEFQKVTIAKAKNKKVDKHVIGWQKDFKLIKGCHIFETSEWR